MLLEIPLSKLVICLVMLVTVIPFFHELGHYSAARLQGIEIKELVLFGFDPHVTTNASDVNIPFLMAGQMYMVMFFYLYSLVFGKIYEVEWLVFMVGIVLGSSYDFYKILLLV